MPAWTGPTGTWNTPSPSTRRNLWRDAGERGQLGAGIEILAQGPDFGPVVVENAAVWIGMADELDAEQILDFALLPVDGVDGVGERRQFRFAGRDGNADQNEAVGEIEDVEVIDEENVFSGAGVFGEEPGEAGVVLFVKRGAKGGGQLEFGVDIKLVRLRSERLLDLRAEPVRQFVKHKFQAGEQSHGALRPAGARMGEKVKMRFNINPPIDYPKRLQKTTTSIPGWLFARNNPCRPFGGARSSECPHRMGYTFSSPHRLHFKESAPLRGEAEASVASRSGTAKRSQPRPAHSFFFVR